MASFDFSLLMSHLGTNCASSHCKKSHYAPLFNQLNSPLGIQISFLSVAVVCFVWENVHICIAHCVLVVCSCDHEAQLNSTPKVNV